MGTKVIDGDGGDCSLAINFSSRSNSREQASFLGPFRVRAWKSAVFHRFTTAAQATASTSYPRIAASKLKAITTRS